MRVDVTVSLARPHDHLLGIEMVLRDAPAGPLEVRMPEWVPGHYGLMNNARFVQDLRAEAGGRACRVTKTDKQTWRVASGEAGTVTLRYDLFAHTLSSSACLFDDTQAHVNGGNAFLYVVGHQDAPCTLRLRDVPRGWKVATSLAPDGPGRWRAPSYDVLIDCPVKVGRFHHETFRVRGKDHHVVVSDLGDTVERLPRLVKDTKAFVTWLAGMFGGLPYDHYWFLCDFHPTRCKGGALEHADSTHLALPMRLDAEDEDDYLRILSIMCHEYFHLWNVKRIRPRGLGPFDYSRESHTTELWVAEGLTDYYAWYALLRGGAIDVDTWLRWMGRYVDAVEDMPGRRTMSLRESSFETWNQSSWQARLSSEDTNTVNRFVNYYTKGAVVGVLLDAALRGATRGRRGLDDVFRALWSRAEAPEGFTAGEVEEEVERLAGARVRRDLERWVDTTAALPYARVLRGAGVAFRQVVPTAKEDDAKHRRKILASFGIEGNEKAPLVEVANVEPGSPAATGGVLRGDVLLALDGARLDPGSWRRVLRAAKTGRAARLTVFRHDRLLDLEVTPRRDPRRMARLEVAAKATPAAVAARRAWLGPAARPARAKAGGAR